MRPQEHSEGCVEDMIDGQPVEPACNLLVPSRAYQAGGRVARSIPALANAALISMVNIDDVRTKKHCSDNSAPAALRFNDFVNRVSLMR
jgi:hypothetical protein